MIAKLITFLFLNQFAFNLLKDVSANDKSDCIFISPLSASMAITMAANGASGETLEQMKYVLGWDNDATLKMVDEYYKNLTKNLVLYDETVQIDVANSLWINQRMKVKKAFMRNLRGKFDATAQYLDFSIPGNENIINKWCSDKTNGRIDEIIDSVSPDDLMFIINALYFKGLWSIPFEPDFTETKEFHGINNSVKDVDMMTLTNNFNYYSNELVSMVEMSYGNGSFVMDIILPCEGKTTSEIVSALDQNTFKQWIDSFEYPEVRIHFPKFRIEYDIKLNDNLSRMGMPISFTSLADFSAMSREKMVISLIKQKSYVEVTEAGTEAAAVTIVGLMKSSFNPEPPKEFNVNRPFIFFIRDTTSGEILFAGEVRNITI